jgi:hypothetical protein
MPSLLPGYEYDIRLRLGFHEGLHLWLGGVGQSTNGQASADKSS